MPVFPAPTWADKLPNLSKPELHVIPILNSYSCRPIMNEMLQCANVNNIFRESASGGMCSVPRGNIMEQKDCKMGFEINFRYSLQQSVTSWRNDISWVVIGVGTPRCIWELQSHSRRLVHLADPNGCISDVVNTKVFQMRRAGYEMKIIASAKITEDGTVLQQSIIFWIILFLKNINQNLLKHLKKKRMKRSRKYPVS
uniref:Uncharacterized protein n=1 Tax=Xenopus tropicalis TaxID=8364 RepID=A0A1B8XYI7_XENTR